MLFVGNDSLLFGEGWEGGVVTTQFSPSSSFVSSDLSLVTTRPLNTNNVNQLSINNINVSLLRELSLTVSTTKTISNLLLLILRELECFQNQTIDIDLSLTLLKLLRVAIENDSDVRDIITLVSRELHKQTTSSIETTDLNLFINRILDLQIDQDVNLTDPIIVYLLIVGFLVESQMNTNDIRGLVERVLSNKIEQELTIPNTLLVVQRLIDLVVQSNTNVDYKLNVKRELKLINDVITSTDFCEIFITRILQLYNPQEINTNISSVDVLRVLKKSVNVDSVLDFLLYIKRDVKLNHNLSLSTTDIKIFLKIFLSLLSTQNITTSDIFSTKTITTGLNCSTEKELGDFVLTINRQLQLNANKEMSLDEIKVYLFAVSMFNRLSMKIIQ